MPESRASRTSFVQLPEEWVGAVSNDVYVLLSVLDGQQWNYEMVEISHRQLAARLHVSTKTIQRNLGAAVSAGYVTVERPPAGRAPGLYRLNNPVRDESRRKPGKRISDIDEQTGKATERTARRVDTNVHPSVIHTPDTVDIDVPEPDTAVHSTAPSVDMNVRSTLTSTKKNYPEEERNTSPSPQPIVPAIAVHGGAVKEFLSPIETALPSVRDLDERTVARMIREPLQSGWDPSKLGRAVLEHRAMPEHVFSAEKFLRHRLDAVKRLPPLRKVVMPELCGECDNRWVNLEDGRVMKCPQCHPQAVKQPTGLHEAMGA